MTQILEYPLTGCICGNISKGPRTFGYSVLVASGGAGGEDGPPQEPLGMGAGVAVGAVGDRGCGGWWLGPGWELGAIYYIR